MPLGIEGRDANGDQRSHSVTLSESEHTR
ncbi:hypothetical protein FHT70_003250 [Rhizobium sp. BK049]|nr:hypothetical protein [Rhizobium sp. BK049]